MQGDALVLELVLDVDVASAVIGWRRPAIDCNAIGPEEVSNPGPSDTESHDRTTGEGGRIDSLDRGT